jgi:hypothetical protein
MAGYESSQNTFAILKVQAEREHRVTLNVVIGGVKGRFIKLFSTKADINVDFSVTPLTGDTNNKLNFKVVRQDTTTEQLKFVWKLEVDAEEEVIGETVQDNYTNTLTRGGSGEENTAKVIL